MSENFNIGYKKEFGATEVKEAHSKRDEILNAMATCLKNGVNPESDAVFALVQRYCNEFIDIYLYKSTPIIIYGLSTVLDIDQRNRTVYEKYQAGLADYLSTAFRCYYERHNAAKS